MTYQQPLWHKHYPQALKDGLSYAPYATIIELMDDVFAKNQHKTAFSMLGNDITYSFVKRHSVQLATYFQDLKLKKGARVAVMMPNIHQFPISLMAIWRAGLIGVNINPLYTPDEIAKQLADAECEAIVILDVFAKNLQLALDRIPSLKHIIVAKIGDHLGLFKGSLINYVAKNIKKAVPKYSLPKGKVVEYMDALFIGSQNDLEPVTILPDDIALLQYTGGTTGVSKGAALTHNNLTVSILNNQAWFYPVLEPVLKDNQQQLTVLTVLPLYHVFSLIVSFVCFVYGGRSILIANPRDFAGMMKTISKAKVNVFPAVNTLFNAFLMHPDFAKINFDKLVLTVGGGAPVQQAIAQKWLEKTKVPICEGYGLSECSPVVCCNTVHIPPKLGSIGFPHPNTEVILLDEQQNVINDVNTAGEIAVKGPQVMKGYWRNPTETAESFTADGYFKTGDIAYFDEEGYFFIVDRKKDMILVSGFNVYPNEIEEVVAKIDGVKECAAIGVKDSKSGERVKLFIVATSEVTEQKVRKFCREHLTGYKQPSQIEFRDSLPKSNVGKILRKSLREEVNLTSLVDS